MSGLVIIYLLIILFSRGHATASNANSSLLCSMRIKSNADSYTYYNPEFEYSYCDFSACPNKTLIIDCEEDCDKKGSKLLYIFSLESYIATNLKENTAATAMSYSYRTRSIGSCEDRYQLLETCYNDIQCNNTFIIYGANGGKTTPTSEPTPSFLPTLNPTLINSPTYTKVCPPYSANYTKYATINYVACSFYACPSTHILATAIPSNGKLYAQQPVYGYNVMYRQSSFSFIMPNYIQCGLYNLQQGCQGIQACRGQYIIASTTSSPPQIVPTAGPIGEPTPAPFRVYTKLKTYSCYLFLSQHIFVTISSYFLRVRVMWFVPSTYLPIHEKAIQTSPVVRSLPVGTHAYPFLVELVKETKLS